MIGYLQRLNRPKLACKRMQTHHRLCWKGHRQNAYFHRPALHVQTNIPPPSPHIIALGAQVVCVQQRVGERALDMSDLGLKHSCGRAEVTKAHGKVGQRGLVL